MPNAASYGRSIYADGQHIGDIWCCCMEKGGDPEAMLSYCIFEKSLWGQGIAPQAVALFLREISQLFGFQTIGAFSFCSNNRSIRVLEKAGFTAAETFTEDGIASTYFIKQL